MPWSASEAKSHTSKANTPAKRKKWAAIANSARKESGDDGKAIRIANAALDARFWKGNKFLSDKFGAAFLINFKKDEDYGDCPDCDGSGMQDGEDCPTCGGSGKAQMEDDDDDEDMGDCLNMDRFADGKHTTIRMFDKIELDDAAKIRTLDNGYIAAMPRIARTGIQVYGGDECGRPDMDRVRVYRPESEVFNVDAAHTYTHLPVTLDHPKVLVDSSNWKKYAVGETGDEVLRDGNAVRVPMMLRDSKAIEAFKNGINQLSVGYDCDMEWTSGVTDSGEKYDAIQHGIRANHLAVVAAARGGSSLTIGDFNNDNGDPDDHGEDFNLYNDYNRGEKTMNLRTILIDGLEVQVLDSAATVIQRAMANLESRYQSLHDEFQKAKKKGDDDDEEAEKKDAALKSKDAIIVAKDKELEVKGGEIAALKTQLDEAKKAASPQAIDSAARERASVIDKANTVMGSRVKTDGMTVPEIRRAVVEAKVGNCKDWSDDRVEGAFDAMQVNVFSTDRRMASNNTIDDAVRVFGRPGTGYQTPQEARDKAYNDYDTDLSQAWRGKQAS